MNYDELPPKGKLINFIANEKLRYLPIRIVVIVTAYILMTVVWISCNDTIFGDKREVLWYSVCIIMLLISLLMYWFSKPKIKEYINCCKGRNFSNDILEQLEDAKRDIEVYSVVITAVIAALGNLGGGLLKQNSVDFSTGLSNGTLFIFSNAMFVLFVLIGIIYPGKKLQDGLIRIIEDEKKKNTNDSILRSISEMKRLVSQNKKHKK